MSFIKGCEERRDRRLRAILAAESDLQPAGMERQADGPAKLFQHIKVIRTWRDQPVSKARIERAEQDAHDDSPTFQTLVAWRHLDEDEALALEAGEIIDLEDGCAWGRSPAGQPVEYRLFGNEAVLITFTIAGGWPALTQLCREDAYLEDLMVPQALADLALAVDNRDQLLRHAQHEQAWDYLDDCRPRPQWPASRVALLEEARNVVRSARAAQAAALALEEITGEVAKPPTARLRTLSKLELDELRVKALRQMNTLVDEDLQRRTRDIWGARCFAAHLPRQPDRPIDWDPLIQKFSTKT